MTANSELFVDEVVRDAIEDKMNRLFPGIGLEYTVEIPDGWRGIWIEADYPNGGTARVIYEAGAVGAESLARAVHQKLAQGEDISIAEVSWKTKFYIEEGIGGKYIAAEPVKIQVKRLIRPAMWETLRKGADQSGSSSGDQ